MHSFFCKKKKKKKNSELWLCRCSRDHSQCLAHFTFHIYVLETGF